MGRPNRLLRWGYGSGAILVEPSSGKAETGYVDGELVPAGWLNAHLHLTGAWLGYLRGPNLGNWTRAAHAALDPFDAGKLFGLAADTATLDTDLPVYRYALIGEVTSTPALRVSRRGIGAGWVARALPAMTGECRGVAFVGRWLVWSETSAELWSTIADDQSGNSAIGTDDNTKWSLVGLASGLRVKAAAWCAGATGRAANARHAVVVCEGGPVSSFTLLVSTDSGATWTAKPMSWSGSAYAPDIAYDPTRDVFVVISGRAAIAVSPSGAPGGTWVEDSGPGVLSGGDPFQIRCGAGTWIAFAATSTPYATPVAYRVTNGGLWESLTATIPREPGTSNPVAMTDIVYADGVWVMTVADAPYLYVSHDDGDTWERGALPIGEEATWGLSRVIYADGQVLASGLGFCVASGRAMGTADGTLVPDSTPSILSDAYRLRGRTIHTTAPNDGDVYAWNAATSRWEPVAASSLSVTTTRGDLIRRGASADERLAIGAAARYLRSDGTDPSWQQIAAADITGLPWTTAVPPESIATDNAVEQTLATISAATDHLYVLDLVIGAREAARTFSVAWRVLATVSSDGAAATLVDVLISGPTDGGASGCAVAIDTSGTDIRARVTGLGGTSITWGVQGTVQRIGS